ncbi:MAG: ABC transporter substrate-binding protein [Chloroflexi bacterium]|nr:ABC transporter substrate-binding protein [Chloroflexota bacterium]MDL1883662.1 ABC transporter substrate-binding protein [Anaerolineae bacterium CFX8]
MLRKSFFVLLLISLLLTAGAAGAQDGEPLKIGLLQDLSGWLSLYGVESVNGFRLGLLYAAGIDPTEYDSLEAALAAVQVGGRPVEIVIKDYGSENAANDADNAASKARELIESDGVEVIYGVPNSGAAVALQGVIAPDNYDIILMAGPTASPTITGANFNVNTFRVCRNTFHDALSLSTIADQVGQKWIQIAVDTDFGRATAAAFQAANEGKVEFVQDTILVPSDTTDFTPFIQQILDSGADVVNPIFAGQLTALWTQQAIELGLVDKVASISGTNSNDAIVLAPPIPDSIAYIVYQYTLPKTEINDWLTEKHIALFNDVPDLFTECAFASAQALYLALEATGGDTTPEALIGALEGLRFEGPKGEYYIRPEDHQVIMPQYLIRFKSVEEVDLGNGTTMMLPQYELFAEVSAEDTAPPCQAPADRSSDSLTCAPPG